MLYILLVTVLTLGGGVSQDRAAVFNTQEACEAQAAQMNEQYIVAEPTPYDVQDGKAEEGVFLAWRIAECVPSDS